MLWLMASNSVAMAMVRLIVFMFFWFLIVGFCYLKIVNFIAADGAKAQNVRCTLQNYKK